jgi:hypothetical protein
MTIDVPIYDETDPEYFPVIPDSEVFVPLVIEEKKLRKKYRDMSILELVQTTAIKSKLKKKKKMVKVAT